MSSALEPVNLILIPPTYQGCGHRRSPGRVHQIHSSQRYPELKEAIVEKFQRDNGLNYSSSQIIVSCGGKHACYNIMMALATRAMR